MPHTFFSWFVGAFVLLGTVLAPAASYAATATLYPNNDGSYTDWTPKSGTVHKNMVDETNCNGTTDYVWTTGVATYVRDSYRLQLTPTIPNGSTITSIQITPCASRHLSGSGTSTVLNVFYRLNGLNSSYKGNHSLTGTTPTVLSSSSWSGLSIVTGSTTNLQIGARFFGGNRGARLSHMKAVITYIPPSSFAVAMSRNIPWSQAHP